jgi:hypothetical protein
MHEPIRAWGQQKTAAAQKKGGRTSTTATRLNWYISMADICVVPTGSSSGILVNRNVSADGAACKAQKGVEQAIVISERDIGGGGRVKRMR